jgi:hypothetical protein
VAIGFCGARSRDAGRLTLLDDPDELEPPDPMLPELELPPDEPDEPPSPPRDTADPVLEPDVLGRPPACAHTAGARLSVKAAATAPIVHPCRVIACSPCAQSKQRVCQLKRRYFIAVPIFYACFASAPLSPRECTRHTP